MSDLDRDPLILNEKIAGSSGALEGLDNSGDGPPLPELDFPPDPQLVAEGWERRFMTDAERVKESIELYDSLGFAVRAEPVKSAELSVWCADCQLVVCRSFVTIYTRKK